MIQVRKVKPNDIEELYKNAEELSFDPTLMLDKLENMMLVLNGGTVCGIGFGIQDEEMCLLNWVYISKDYRKDRLGTALVKTILNNAELSGSSTAYLSGFCDEFAASLRFEKVEEGGELTGIKEQYNKHFGNYEDNFYKVSLIDYFKPCCGK